MLLTLAAAWRPPENVGPKQWAEANRKYPASTGHPGPRSLELTPYIIPFVEFFRPENGYEVCTFVSGTQVSKTEAFLDAIGWRLATRPRPQLYVGPTKEFVSDVFEPRLAALFEQAAEGTLRVAGGRNVKKTRKMVNGVPIRLAHGGSPSSLASDQAGDVYIDEYDKMPSGVGKDADPFTLAKARASTYRDRKIAVTSTPKRGNVATYTDPATGLEFWKVAEPADIESPIWLKWQSGTRHHWAWKCPHCRSWFIPRMKLLKAAGGDKATAYQARMHTQLICPNSGCVIEESSKAEMNAGGQFIAPGMTIDEVGDVGGDPEPNSNYSLWVSGLASPFMTWGERLEEAINAESSGESDARQGAQNNVGEVWAPKFGDMPEWQEILDSREPYPPGVMPDGAFRVGMAVDVQTDRLVYGKRAFGARATSWLVEHGELLGDTAQVEVWQDLADKVSEHVDGFPVSLCFIDSGFRPGKKFSLPLNRVYEFARRFRGRVFATKGSSHKLQRPLVKQRPDVNRKAEIDKYGLELIRLDTDHWKSWVHERIKWPKEQLGAWHLHEKVDEYYCRQLVAEQRVVNDDGKAEWIERSRQNHYLDVEAMLAAVGFMLNVHLVRKAPVRDAVEEDPETAAVAAELAPVVAVGNAIPGKSDKRSRMARLAARLNRGVSDE